MPLAQRFHRLNASIAIAYGAIAITLLVFVRPAESTNMAGSLADYCRSIAKL